MNNLYYRFIHNKEDCHIKKENKNGFTLIEVLIAIVIFGMVISIVFASFREIAVSAKIVDQSSKDYEMANACLRRITADLESVYVRQGPDYIKPEFDSLKDPYRFEGGTSMAGTILFPVVRFTSMSHLPVDRDFKKGIAEIVYYVAKDDAGDFELRRADRISFEEEFEKSSTDPVLCKQIGAVSLKYYDDEGEVFEDWDSETEESGFATPASVSINIKTGEEGNYFSFGTRVTLRSVRTPEEKK